MYEVLAVRIGQEVGLDESSGNPLLGRLNLSHFCSLVGGKRPSQVYRALLYSKPGPGQHGS